MIGDPSSYSENIVGTIANVLGIDPGIHTALSLIVVDLEESKKQSKIIFKVELARVYKAKGRNHSTLYDDIHGYFWNVPKDSLIAIEDFTGGGWRDSNMISTMKIGGFLEGYCKIFKYDYKVQAPQSRLAFVSPAKEQVNAQKIHKTFDASDDAGHAISATAHALRRVYDAHFEGTTTYIGNPVPDAPEGIEGGGE